MKKSFLTILQILLQLGLEIIKENFEFIDSEIQKDSKRKENWSVELHDMKCLTTSLGDVHFSKNIFLRRPHTCLIVRKMQQGL